MRNLHEISPSLPLQIIIVANNFISRTGDSTFLRYNRAAKYLQYKIDGTVEWREFPVYHYQNWNKDKSPILLFPNNIEII